MAQTHAGAIRIAAKNAGISVAEYESRVASGHKWCSGCKDWHPTIRFGKDKTRPDGLAASCIQHRGKIYRRDYVPTPRPAAGRRFAIPRDGDKKQARARANHLANVGLLPKPNTVPCVDCGHVWKNGDRRHEFDHAEGYAGDKQHVVEVVCSQCHHDRHPIDRKRKADGTFAGKEG